MREFIKVWCQRFCLGVYRDTTCNRAWLIDAVQRVGSRYHCF